jgi:hypothetical protein
MMRYLTVFTEFFLARRLRVSAGSLFVSQVGKDGKSARTADFVDIVNKVGSLSKQNGYTAVTRLLSAVATRPTRRPGRV